MLYYTIHKIRATLSTPPPHLLPFGQCIVEQTTLPLLNSLIVYCRVSSNFHFSLSIILFLVQKYWSIKKISRGGWSGFGKALVWIDPNCHENCLDWSKLFSSLSKLYPNRRCSVILPFLPSFCPTSPSLYCHQAFVCDTISSPPQLGSIKTHPPSERVWLVFYQFKFLHWSLIYLVGLDERGQSVRTFIATVD